MRRDVFIQNDSGGFSVLAAASAAAIIDDSRSDDEQWVRSNQAMLIELYGDDSMPVRIVVDEPLHPDEDAQWLARASWRIDAPDGRLLVMGGFDPDVLSWWLEEHAPEEDGQGVALVVTTPGSWRVDVYAHVGSMNGRAILSESGDAPGASFRASHPERAFPVWLAKMLDFSGEDDPGHEDLWKDVPGSIRDGRLEIDTSSTSAVGFLIHLTPYSGELPDLPAGGWFDRRAGARVPDVFPLGLPAAVPDPDLEIFLDRALSRPRPDDAPPIATDIIEIIQAWDGDPLKRLAGGGHRALAPTSLFWIYWMTAFCSDSPPHFELLVTPKGPWTPPDSSPEYAVLPKGGAMLALGPPANTGGWFTWRAARKVAEALVGIPDGSTLDFAMTRVDRDTEDDDPAIGRALYSGDVVSGAWQISEASPAVSLDTLDAALSFVEDVVERRLVFVRGEAERRALDRAAARYAPEPGSLVRDGDTVSLAEHDERTLLLLAEQVFRVRFAGSWAMSASNEDDESEDE